MAHFRAWVATARRIWSMVMGPKGIMKDSDTGGHLQKTGLYVGEGVSYITTLQTSVVHKDRGRMHEQEIRVEGMTCQHCVMAVQKALDEVPGITVKVVRVGAVVYSTDDIDRAEKRVRAAITDAGYKPVA
jgi:copper chaperone CopZ